MTGPAADPLDELRARVAAAQAAAERLAEETAGARAQAGAVPRAASATSAEIHALASVAHAVRALLPVDLWDQLCDLVLGLLRLVRATLDRWIDAMQAPSAGPPAARDIPIG